MVQPTKFCRAKVIFFLILEPVKKMIYTKVGILLCEMSSVQFIDIIKGAYADMCFGGHIGKCAW